MDPYRQLTAVSHGGHRSGWLWPLATSERQQLVGVRRRLMDGDDGIVAGPLCLLPKPAPTHPHQRMKPVGGADQPREPMHQDVSARDVREFVSQRTIQILPRPALRILGQQNDRPHDAARHRSVDGGVMEYANSAVLLAAEPRHLGQPSGPRPSAPPQTP